MREDKIRYFVTYAICSGRFEHVYNSEIERAVPICSIRDIRDIEEELANKFNASENVTLLNWQRFEDE